MLVRVLGLREYLDVWKLQRQLVERRERAEIPDTLLLVEHPSVYTCGVSSKAALPGPLPHPYHVVERGGDFTYHGPGQIVGYPIFDIGRRGLTARGYLRALEAILIETLEPLGAAAATLRGFTGVWCEGRKLASIGIAVKGQIAYHGFALNVSCDLAPFRAIHPCNLEPEQMTTLERVVGRRLDPLDVARRVGETFLRYWSQPAPL